MASDSSARIDNHFASLSDPRRGKVTYPLINIITIALCATIAGADDLVAIADWARHEEDWLGLSLDLSCGIASRDRFNAVSRALKHEPFERCPVAGIAASHEVTAGQLVAIDGKSMRQSLDKAGARSALLRRIKGNVTTETVRAITSLGRERASAERLLAISRGHWHIENRLHWVRDVSLDEDACRVRTGEAPEVLAAIRNAVLRLLRSGGVIEIAATLRRRATAL